MNGVSNVAASAAQCLRATVLRMSACARDDGDKPNMKVAQRHVVFDTEQKPYILFIPYVDMRPAMNEPTIKKPTKKTFHFPKAAGGAPGKEDQAEAVAPIVDAPKKKAAARKASKPTAPVESAPVKAAGRAKVKRARKDKVVRDSFTMPKSDYEKLAALKQKCLAAGVSVKKSELLRAGLLMLESAAPKRLLAAVSAVEQVKTGRPAKS
jgi:hypothetical protein